MHTQATNGSQYKTKIKMLFSCAVLLSMQIMEEKEQKKKKEIKSINCRLLIFHSSSFIIWWSELNKSKAESNGTKKKQTRRHTQSEKKAIK